MSEEKAVLGKSMLKRASKSENKILQDIAKRVEEEEEKPVHHYSRMHHRH